MRDSTGPHNTAQSGYVTAFAHFSILKKIIAEEAACTRINRGKAYGNEVAGLEPATRTPGRIVRADSIWYDEMRRIRFFLFHRLYFSLTQYYTINEVFLQ